MSQSPSLDQLKRATHIVEQIEALQAELNAILSGTAVKGKRGRKPGSTAAAPKKSKGTRVMSAEARERIAAAQRKRWAKAKRAKKAGDEE